jgi:hypothetical protein
MLLKENRNYLSNIYEGQSKNYSYIVSPNSTKQLLKKYRVKAFLFLALAALIT